MITFIYLFSFLTESLPELQGLTCGSCSCGNYALPVTQIFLPDHMKAFTNSHEQEQMLPGLKIKLNQQQQLLRIPEPSGLSSMVLCCYLSAIHAIKGKSLPMFPWCWSTPGEQAAHTGARSNEILIEHQHMFNNLHT